MQQSNNTLDIIYTDKPTNRVCQQLTCTVPESVPEQNCGDSEAAVCWVHQDWKDSLMNWSPVNTQWHKQDEHFGWHYQYDSDTELRSKSEAVVQVQTAAYCKH